MKQNQTAVTLEETFVADFFLSLECLVGWLVVRSIFPHPICSKDSQETTKRESKSTQNKDGLQEQKIKIHQNGYLKLFYK